MNKWNREIYAKAWHFATIKHAGQTYGGAEPNEKLAYINHIGSVATEIVWALHHSDEIIDADLAIQCAILHDTIEDTDTTFDELKTIFGEDVANGVLALTKNEKKGSKKEQMTDSLARIKAQPKAVWMVKMADRISNLYHPPHYWNNEKILAYAEEARLIFNALNEANEVLNIRLKEKIDNYASFLR
jgi:guanosine-3',5'-bis(diphosphate) 3'-pyrophosphohydrolase